MHFLCSMYATETAKRRPLGRTIDVIQLKPPHDKPSVPVKTKVSQYKQYSEKRFADWKLGKIEGHRIFPFWETGFLNTQNAAISLLLLFLFLLIVLAHLSQRLIGELIV